MLFRSSRKSPVVPSGFTKKIKMLGTFETNDLMDACRRKRTQTHIKRNTIYGTVPAKYLKKLQTAQNSGLRAVFGLPKLTPTEVLHTKANIDKLDKRRDRACIIQAYNRTRDPKHLDKRNLRTRRHDALSLIVPASRTTLSQKAFAYRGPTAWNELPPEVRLERDRDKFKKKLDTHLGTKKKMKFPIINNPI